jgi:hypothetical protein
MNKTMTSDHLATGQGPEPREAAAVIEWAVDQAEALQKIWTKEKRLKNRMIYQVSVLLRLLYVRK